MEVEDDVCKEGPMAKEGEIPVPDQSDMQTNEWQQTSHHDPLWDRPPYHQGEHASTAPPWDRSKTSHESSGPLVNYGQHFL